MPEQSTDQFNSRGGSHPWRAILNNTGWLLGEKLLRWTVAMCMAVWTARYLGPDDFGSLSAAISFVSLFLALAPLGLESIAVRDLVRASPSCTPMLGTLIGLRLVSGLSLTGLAILVSFLAGYSGHMGALIPLLSLTIVVSSGEVFDYVFQANLWARQATVARSAAFLLATIIRCLLIVFKAPVIVFALLLVAESLFTSILLLIVYRRLVGASLNIVVVPSTVSRLLRESWPNIVASLAGISYMRLDRVFLERLSGSHEVGYYSAGASLVEASYFLPMAIVASSTPMLTRLFASNEEEFTRQLKRLAHRLSLLAWSLVIIFAVSSIFIIPHLFGPAYIKTGSVVLVLCWGLPFCFLGVAGSPWYLNRRLFIYGMYRHLAGALVNMLLNIALIPYYGAIGAAVATVVGFASAHVFGNLIWKETRQLAYIQFRALINPRFNTP